MTGAGQCGHEFNLYELGPDSTISLTGYGAQVKHLRYWISPPFQAPIPWKSLR
jgi:hypothetical protein